MYVVPILVLTLVIVAGAVWSPVFALLIAVPLFALFLACVGLSRRAGVPRISPHAIRHASATHI